MGAAFMPFGGGHPAFAGYGAYPQQGGQPFGGAQSMPAMYGQGGQLNLAAMAPGSQMSQMAQHMGGQSQGLTGPGGVPQQQPFAANGGQFATNAQVSPQMQAQRFGQQGAFNPQQMGTMNNMGGMANPRMNPGAMQQPLARAGGMGQVPAGYRVPGRF